MAFTEILILDLKKIEQATFRSSLAKSGKADSVELKYFDYVHKNPGCTPQDIMHALYGEGKREAFKKVQQRLAGKIITYHQQLDEFDVSPHGDTHREQMLAQKFIRRKNWIAAKKYLDVVEQNAINTRKYELLEWVYTLHLRHCQDFELSARETIQKRDANRALHHRFCQIDEIFALLNERYAKARRSGVVLDKDEIVREALKQCELTPAEANNPAFMVKLMSLLRKVAASNKDWVGFERVVTKVLFRMKRAGCFTPADVEWEVALHDMVAHSLYRNAEFEEALKIVESADELARQMPGANRAAAIKRIALRAAIYNFTGRVKEAIPILQKALSELSPHESPEDGLDMRMNLAAYHYNARQYKEAVQVLQSIPFDNNTLGEIMGLEWRFKKEMFELISFVDRNIPEKALTTLRRMKETFGIFFKQSQYSRVPTYLEFVELLVKDPQIVHKPAFLEKLKEAKLNLPNAHEDLHAIMFHCWVTCKIFNQDYYETLMKAIEWKRGRANTI
ncbi:MAG: tetratricopeptide repeat protein [Flavobacteriales bacterium]|jgi:tetratricopeptide (TPR) repeat protein